MANVKSAEKRNRQNQKRRARNRANQTAVKSAAHKGMEIIRKDAKAAVEALRVATSAIARAARKGAIPKGRASRKISRLAKAKNRTTANA